MQEIEKMTARQLYRGILQGMRKYPSTNRILMRQAIVEDVGDWKMLSDKMEVKKAMKKMRMLYGHVCMWECKMEEVLAPDSVSINKPLPLRDINQKKDDDFVYF